MLTATNCTGVLREEMIPIATTAEVSKGNALIDGSIKSVSFAEHQRMAEGLIVGIALAEFSFARTRNTSIMR